MTFTEKSDGKSPDLPWDFIFALKEYFLKEIPGLWNDRSVLNKYKEVKFSLLQSQDGLIGNFKNKKKNYSSVKILPPTSNQLVLRPSSSVASCNLPIPNYQSFSFRSFLFQNGV